MKALLNTLVLASVLFTAGLANAGSLRTVCKNHDGSVLVSDEQLVSLEKDEFTKGVNLLVETNLSGANYIKGAKIEFGDINPTKVYSTMKIVSVSAAKTIASDDGGKCKGGHGPGFETTRYSIKTLLKIGDKQRAVDLTCLETSGWSGTCQFDE